MRKLFTFTAMALAALSAMVAPATASDIPHSDTDPSHWLEASVKTATGPCEANDEGGWQDYSCDFTGTADNFTFSSFTPTGNSVVSCQSVVGYHLEFFGSTEESAHEASTIQQSCGGAAPQRRIHICAYSSDGGFGETTEFWMRENPLGDMPAHEGAFGQIYGYWDGSGHPFLGEGADFDNQTIYDDGSYAYTIDATYEFDVDMSLEPGIIGVAVPCSFPELSS